MPSKPMFVMATADTCGHCQNLHKKWAPIRKSIQSLGIVRVTEVRLPKMNSSVTEQGYPAGIQKHLQWFPTGLMFSGEVWDKAVTGGSSGDMEGLTMESSTPLTAEGIVGWIKNNISKLPGGGSESKSPATPREASNQGPTLIPTSGSARICREMNIKPRRRYW